MTNIVIKWLHLYLILWFTTVTIQWDHQVCQILKLLDMRKKYGRRVTLNSYNCKTSINFLLFHLCQRQVKTKCKFKVNWRRIYKEVNKQDKSKYSRVPVIHPSTIHH